MSDVSPHWPPATKAQVAGLVALREAAERRATAACLVEGELLLDEALAAGLVPRLVAVVPALAAHAVVRRAHDRGAAVVELAQRAADRASDREHAPGLLACVPLPPAWDTHLALDGAALVVVLCGLQDPGNVGTLLRSARAFGATAFLVTPGTADPFGPKVVRASAGAALRLPVAAFELDALPALARQGALEVVAAVAPRAGEAPVAADSSARLPRRCLLLLGHETRGVPALPGCGRVRVAQEPDVDSLNVAVAGSILMADWYRAVRA